MADVFKLAAATGMDWHWVDISIILLYLIVTIGIGFLVQKRAGKNLNSYFLGGKTIPWYILSVSQAAGMFDIAGTMWLIALCFVYGVKGIYMPFMYPWFNHIFAMVFIAIWIRRSNVLTGAEWIKTRFGNDRGSELSQISVVLFALILTIAMLAYAFEGIGKFGATFLPWDFSQDTYAILIMSVTAIYVILGGFHSVTLTAVMQFLMMTVAGIIVAVIAMTQINPEMLANVVPDGWFNLALEWKMKLNWEELIPLANNNIANEGYSYLTLFFMMMMLKGVLVSTAGPVPNYDMQRILATRNAKEAAWSYGLVSLVVLLPRYLMVAAIAVLALVKIDSNSLISGGSLDFELVLPQVMTMLPVGVFGLLMAGLLAAFMSTFAATLNAGGVYLVNDVYKKYMIKDASPKHYVVISYFVTIAMLGIGIGFGFGVESIGVITGYVFGGLFTGYIASNVLKWTWWRFNGFGYFWGMMAGIAAAVAGCFIATWIGASETDYAQHFSFCSTNAELKGYFANFMPLGIIPIGLLGSIVGTLLTKPEDDEILMKFYKQVRPWGFWKPVRDKIAAVDPSFVSDANFKRDMVNVSVGIVWQTTLTILPIFFVIKMWRQFFMTLAVTVIASIFLKFNWLNKLKDD